jgi:hypothetical protein
MGGIFEIFCRSFFLNFDRGNFTAQSKTKYLSPLEDKQQRPHSNHQNIKSKPYSFNGMNNKKRLLRGLFRF